MDGFGQRNTSPGRGRSARGGLEDEDWGARDDFGRNDSYRRRSPGPHDRRQRRGRSRSPMQIDRYQPGRRDDATGTNRREDHRRRSPPPNVPNIDRYVPGHEPPPMLINPMPNPFTLTYQVGFSWFAEWWRKEQEVKEERERSKTGARKPPDRVKGEKEAREERDRERPHIQAAYDEYKEKLQTQVARQFVREHKQEEWFKERYDPDLRTRLRQKLAEFRRGLYTKWDQDFDSGVFDEFTLEGIYKNESNGAGGVIEKEEGETTAAAEILGVGDLVPSKGAALKDESALQPALLIKTIAPNVNRENLENFCKEHLGDGDGGYKWLSLSDPNLAKKCHRIGWVIINPGEQLGETQVSAQPQDRGDGRDEENEMVEEGEAHETDAMDTTDQTGVTASAITRAQEAINGKTVADETRGNFTCHVGTHNPSSNLRKKALWDLFSAPERVDRDLQLVARLVSKLEEDLGEAANAVPKIEQRVEELRNSGALRNMYEGLTGTSNSKGDADMENGKSDDDEEGEEAEEGAWEDDDKDDEELLAKKKKLDLCVEYLRRVFNFCFFCVFESDSVHELSRKCPGGHLRRPRASLTTSAKLVAKASAYGEQFPFKKSESSDDQQENMEADSPVTEKQPRFQKNNKSHQQLQRAFNWVKTYEDKLYQLLEPGSVDLKKLGGKALGEAMDEELKKHVKQEDEMKYRCRAPDCSKLFKGETFWRKHVEKRHKEWHDTMEKEFAEINAYVLDPAHVSPARSDAASSGHFLQNPQMQSGTPRGFNFAQMQQQQPPPHHFHPQQPGMFPHMGFQPPPHAQYPMAMPPTPTGAHWPAPHAMGMPMGIPGMGYMPNGMPPGGRPGPVRTGGRHNNRTGGPYDRTAKDGRNARWNSGRLTPPKGSGGPMRGGPGRFPDGGPQAAGPKEATVGRTMKSYEDLDAVGGSGDGQLDY